MIDGAQSMPAMALEDAAREALDQHANRVLSDAEWQRTRARLLEFAGILRDWDRNAGRGNV